MAKATRIVLELAGFDELRETLRSFGPAMEKKVMRKAMRDGSQPILQEAKRLCPVGQDDQDIAGRTEQLGLTLRVPAQKAAKAGKRAAKHSFRERKKSGQHYPGQLRDSLKIRALKSRKGRLGVAVQTEKGFFKGATFYGAFVEFGTRKMAARPFIRPAFDSTKMVALRLITASVKSGLDDLASGATKLRKLDYAGASA